MLIERTKKYVIELHVKKALKGKDRSKISQEAIDELYAKAALESDYAVKLKEWFENARALTTHSGKFTHPDVRINTLIFTGDRNNDGFVRSGNIDIEKPLDIYGNAASDGKVWDLYQYLTSKIDDETRIIDLFEKETEETKKLIESAGLNYTAVREKFLGIFKSSNSLKTSSLLKQVYFPVEKNYHLLSLLTSSVICSEVKRRIDAIRFSEESKNARELKKQGKYSENGFKDIYNLTVIGYGGTKPQNISVLNNQAGGKFYLLPSFPPIIEKRDIRLPRYDFFRTNLRYKNFESEFFMLHNLIMQERNNKAIRDKIITIIISIADKIMQNVYLLRRDETGWSNKENYKNTKYKIWLDDYYLEERENSETWQLEVLEACAKWIIKTYHKLCKQKNIMLGDEEFRHIKNLIEETINQSKEFIL